MAMKLEKENVRIIFMSILDDCDLYGREGKEAEHLLDYIAGAKDMANMVMDAIVALGGRRMKQTVVFDFDGVIHSYTSGWKGETVIPDPPVLGIKEAIAEIRAAGYEVVVVSTRCVTREGMSAVRDWLWMNDIKVDVVQKSKPPAIVYIDDRAICFDGKPDELLTKIQTFKPWNK